MESPAESDVNDGRRNNGDEPRSYRGVSLKNPAPILSDSRLFSGFYNLLFICIFGYIISYCIPFYIDHGSVTPGIVFNSISQNLGMVMAIFCFAIFVTYMEYCNIKLLVWGVPMFLLWIVHILLLAVQIIVPFGTVINEKLQPAQAAFVTIESIILGVKMHSFFVSNVQLSRVRAYYDKTETEDESEDTDSAVEIPEFPKNVTLWNFTYFLLAPVLVYETHYPISPRIRLGYVIERSLCVLLLLMLDVVLLEAHILPSLMLVNDQPFYRTYFATIFPLTSFYLSSLFVTFEFILPLIAEVTFFNDRFFYDDWWNAANMAEFAKKWNRPLYKFLVRHVFFAARGKVSQSFAIAISFIVECVVDEAILFAVFRKPSKWFLILLVIQLPPMFPQVLQIRAIRNAVFLLGLVLWLPLALLMHGKAYIAENQLLSA